MATSRHANENCRPMKEYIAHSNQPCKVCGLLMHDKAPAVWSTWLKGWRHAPCDLMIRQMALLSKRGTP